MCTVEKLANFFQLLFGFQTSAAQVSKKWLEGESLTPIVTEAIILVSIYPKTINTRLPLNNPIM
jgi:hypothetical protein